VIPSFDDSGDENGVAHRTHIQDIDDRLPFGAEENA
jgi:hypothetical protein